MTARILALLAALSTAATLRAADPVAPLKPLVPADAAVVFVVRDLSATLKTLAASPMAGWLAGSPLGKQLVAPADAQKLAAARDFLAAQLGVTSEELRDGVFGEAVVFAFTPGEPGKPETDVSTLLVRPRDPAALERLVGRVNKLEQVTARPAEHKGVGYVAREKPGKAGDFYFFKDGVFALSSREATLHAVIAAAADDRPPPKWLALDDGAATLSVLFNPRPFDAGWAARAAGPADTDFHRQFAKLWAAVDGLCLSAAFGDGLTMKLSADVRREQLPSEWQALWDPAGASSLQGIVAPPDALIAVNFRTPVKRLLDAAASFLPGGSAALQKQLDDLAGPAFGRDSWPAVLAGLDKGLTIWVRPSATEATLEGAVTIGIGYPESAARPGLDALAHLARLDYNRKHADQVTLRQTDYGATAENLRGFPAGFAPTYRVSGDEYTGRGHVGTASVGTNPATAARLYFDRDPPQLRVSLIGCHTYLKQHGAAAAKFLAGYEKRPAAEIERELGDLLPLLEAGKSAELRLGRVDSRMTGTLTVEFVKPLR